MIPLLVSQGQVIRWQRVKLITVAFSLEVDDIVAKSDRSTFANKTTLGGKFPPFPVKGLTMTSYTSYLRHNTS